MMTDSRKLIAAKMVFVYLFFGGRGWRGAKTNSGLGMRQLPPTPLSRGNVPDK